MPRDGPFVLDLKNERIKVGGCAALPAWKDRARAEQVEEPRRSAQYGLFDDGHGLIGNKNGRFVLAWNLIPYSGMLPRIEAGRRRVQFPGEYAGRHA